MDRLSANATNRTRIGLSFRNEMAGGAVVDAQIEHHTAGAYIPCEDRSNQLKEALVIKHETCK